MNNRKENEQSCIVMNKKEGTSCITTHLLFYLSRSYIPAIPDKPQKDNV